MKNNASVFYAFLLIIGDFVALLAAFVAAFIIRVTYGSPDLVNPIRFNDYLVIWALLAPVWIVIFAFLGLYRRSVYEYRLREIGALLLGSILGIMTVITYDFIADTPIFPARLVPVYGLVIGFLLLLLERTLLRAGRMLAWRYGHGVTNILVVGNSQNAQRIVGGIHKPSRTGYRIVAFAGDQKPAGFRGRYFNDVDEALTHIDGLGIHTVLVVGKTSENKLTERALAAAQAAHCSFKFVPAHDGVLSNNIEVELFQGLPVVSVHQTALVGWGRIAKRLFDIFAALAAIVILSPVFVVVAIVVRVSDWGPAIFKQNRLSRFGTHFNIYKFRTNRMAYNGLDPEEAFAKMGKPHLAKKYRANGDFLANDPRVTSVGHFLRKTSLDELPQLFNVLKGDISLVGPRALIPRELANYPFKNLLLSVKSGLTGLAQVSGRRDIGFEERRALDLYYVQNWSFWLDIKILFRTVIDVLGGRGAK